MRTILALGLFLQIAAYSAPTTAAPTPIDAKKFFKDNEGKYKIELVAGKPPHAEGIQESTVDPDVDEAYLSMPYCVEGEGCDPGYIDLTYEKTKVTQEKLKDESYKYTIRVEDGTDKRVYYWTRQKNNKIKFANPQYRFNGGPIQNMEHLIVLKPKPVPPPDPVAP